MKKQTPVDEAEQIQQAILMRELEEEIQKEKLLNLWKKYRVPFIGTIIAVIAFTAGNEIYRSWYEKVKLAESNQFEQAIVLNVTKQTEDAQKIYQNLIAESKTGYGALSEMRLAQIAFDKNDTAGGLAHLKNVMNNTDLPTEIRSIARLSYIGHQVDTAEPNVLLNELNPLLTQTNTALYASVAELNAVLLLRQDNKTQAKDVLTKAVNLPAVSEEAKKRLNALLGIIK
ncbi:MAG: tetratricopeptide repeat protein [Alphaproteobacteria bacterium]|nr:tetratricopeptide repeat protein [Alphaproteobacteria bacterium]